MGDGPYQQRRGNAQRCTGVMLNSRYDRGTSVIPRVSIPLGCTAMSEDLSRYPRDSEQLLKHRRLMLVIDERDRLFVVKNERLTMMMQTLPSSEIRFLHN